MYYTRRTCDRLPMDMIQVAYPESAAALDMTCLDQLEGSLEFVLGHELVPEHELALEHGLEPEHEREPVPELEPEHERAALEHVPELEPGRVRGPRQQDCIRTWAFLSYRWVVDEPVRWKAAKGAHPLRRTSLTLQHTQKQYRETRP